MYYTNPNLYKVKFPIGLDIIDTKILSSNKSHYFEVRKAVITNSMCYLT